MNQLDNRRKVKAFPGHLYDRRQGAGGKDAGQYMRAMDASFEEHKADARRRADMQVAAETEKLEREINKRLSIGQLDLKREAAAGRRS